VRQGLRDRVRGCHVTGGRRKAEEQDE
jgi:hypothetical protein